MAAPQENLEARIERIRKRDEELEKKHREAEEDRLAALKDNAMVKTKTPTSEDWPKVHRYDKFEFSYGNRDTVDGVQPDAVGGGEGGDAGGGQTTGKGGRDYKKFADGQGPPPDPSYNFLADAERDGNAERAAGGVVDNKNKQDWRQQQQGNNGSQQQQQSGQMPNNRSRGGLNNSFKGRNGARAGPRQNGNQGGNARSNKSADSAQEFNQWKSERERIDEARIGRQQLGDGKWRREWDHEKNTTEELNEAVEKINLNQAGPKQQHYKQLPLEQPKTNSQQNYINNNNNSIEMTPKPMEKRGNLMVSVSKDGEVKSVKLQSNRAIGTGRVGPRQSAFQPSYPSGQQQQQQEMEQQFPIVNHFNQQPQPIVPNTNAPFYYQQQPSTEQQQQHQIHQQLPYQHQNVLHHPSNPTHYAQPEPVFYDTPRVQQSTRPNLQDRLARHRQPIVSSTNGPNPSVVSSDNLQPTDIGQLAVGY